MPTYTRTSLPPAVRHLIYTRTAPPSFSGHIVPTYSRIALRGQDSAVLTFKSHNPLFGGFQPLQDYLPSIGPLSGSQRPRRRVLLHNRPISLVLDTRACTHTFKHHLLFPGCKGTSPTRRGLTPRTPNRISSTRHTAWIVERTQTVPMHRPKRNLLDLIVLRGYFLPRAFH